MIAVQRSASHADRVNLQWESSGVSCAVSVDSDVDRSLDVDRICSREASQYSRGAEVVDLNELGDSG